MFARAELDYNTHVLLQYEISPSHIFSAAQLNQLSQVRRIINRLSILLNRPSSPKLCSVRVGSLLIWFQVVPAVVVVD